VRGREEEWETKSHIAVYEFHYPNSNLPTCESKRNGDEEFVSNFNNCAITFKLHNAAAASQKERKRAHCALWCSDKMELTVVLSLLDERASEWARERTRVMGKMLMHCYTAAAERRSRHNQRRGREREEKSNIDTVCDDSIELQANRLALKTTHFTTNAKLNVMCKCMTERRGGKREDGREREREIKISSSSCKYFISLVLCLHTEYKDQNVKGAKEVLLPLFDTMLQ
jgi:hypothetical protein